VPRLMEAAWAAVAEARAAELAASTAARDEADETLTPVPAGGPPATGRRARPR